MGKGGKNRSEDDLPMLQPGEEMMMSEDEICFRFRRNGCRNDHIVILAQLNAVYPDTIVKILNRNGLYDHETYLPETDRKENCAW